MKKDEINNAHEYFSKHCFNKTWDFIDKTEHTNQEELEMLATAFASFYHWQNRTDQTNENLSVGYWQLSRVFSLIGDAPNALKFGRQCLAISKFDDVGNFYLGYAYEALARAEMVNNNIVKMDEYLTEANNICSNLKDKDEKKYLSEDLKTIKL